ncbi:MAG: DUF342 domain-containing protein [Planctomycetes bacterium]|nr:DUF342 domain-containing protein [Planctomycetota bacterium]
MLEQVSETGALDTIEIQIDDSQMEAWVDLPAGAYVDLETIKKAIHMSGLRLTALREILMPTGEDRRIILANGQLRLDGEDGSLQMYVEESLPYSIREDGSYDYHGASNMQTVHEGSRVAAVVEPSEGEIGMTVKGVKVHPHHGVEFHGSTVIGEGTRLKESGEILAEQTGVFSRNRAGKLQVTAQVIIEGDVDLSVGNIDTDKPILVKGDIKSGFTVKSAADITVQGVIEDSRVTAGGHLIVHKGVLPGKQRVKAHGELCAKYIQERRIECGELVVESIIRHAHVSVRSSVHAQSVIGGKISVGNSIVVSDLGNSSGEPTQVRAGVDDYLMACIMQARESRADILHKFEKINSDFKEAHKQTLQLTGKAQSLAQKHAAKHIINVAVQKAQAATVLREEKQQLVKLCEDELASCDQLISCEDGQIRGMDNAFIEVKKDVHPGVEVTFGTLKKKNIISALTAVTFQRVGDEIVVRL